MSHRLGRRRRRKRDIALYGALVEKAGAKLWDDGHSRELAVYRPRPSHTTRVSTGAQALRLAEGWELERASGASERSRVAARQRRARQEAGLSLSQEEKS